MSVMTRTALLLLALAAPGLARAEAPPPGAVTPELVEKARAEGKIVFYSSADLQLSEHVAKLFEAKYPGISVEVERTGSERVYQRIGQEHAAGIHNCDFVNSSDASHFVRWKRDGWLAAYVPAEVAENYAPRDRDPDGTYATWRATLSPIGYNTQLVKEADAPTSYQDLLDPKWSGKIVKANPNYSGTVMTATYAWLQTQSLGWPFVEALAKQKVMQVQSALEPARKVATGEREILADGDEYLALSLIQKGNPLKLVYPSEGTPLISSPGGILADAPHPNAARLFANFLFSREVQQAMVDDGMRSLHKGVKEPADRVALDKLKILPDDPIAVDKAGEEIKKRYRQLFGS